MVLQTFREHQPYEKISKCDFYKKQNTVFGTCHLRKGVAVDPTKIKAIIIVRF